MRWFFVPALCLCCFLLGFFLAPRDERVPWLAGERQEERSPVLEGRRALEKAVANQEGKAAAAVAPVGGGGGDAVGGDGVTVNSERLMSLYSVNPVSAKAQYLNQHCSVYLHVYRVLERSDGFAVQAGSPESRIPGVALLPIEVYFLFSAAQDVKSLRFNDEVVIVGTCHFKGNRIEFSDCRLVEHIKPEPAPLRNFIEDMAKQAPELEDLKPLKLK